MKPGGELDRGYGVSVAADPGDPDLWYVSASMSPFAATCDEDPKAAVFRYDGGEAWQKLTAFPAERMPWVLCTDPALPNHLWAGRSDGSIVHSTDRVDSWNSLAGTLLAVEYEIGRAIEVIAHHERSLVLHCLSCMSLLDSLLNLWSIEIDYVG